MNDAARSTAFLEHRGLGPVERCIELRGKLELGGGVKRNAELCLTQSGLYLAAAADREHGVAIDLFERPDVAYRIGRVQDRISVGERELSVPAGKGDAARIMFALAQHLRAGAAVGAAIPPARARHINEPSELERIFLAGWLEAGELLLAWLLTSTSLPVSSRFQKHASGQAVLALTDARAAVVVLSALGEARVETLAQPAIERRAALGARVRSGGLSFDIGLGSVGLAEELCTVVTLDVAQRMLEVARLNWLGGAQRPFARRLLERAAQRGDLRARLLTFLVWAELGESDALAPDLAPATDDLAAASVAPGPASPTPEELVALWQRWKLSPHAARRLVDALRALGAAAERWAIALHAAAREKLVAEGPSAVELARADLDLADHLVVAGQRERARGIIEERLAALPVEGIGVLEGDGDAAELRLSVRRAYELLAKTGEAAPDERALAELARLEPLSPGRLQALEDAAVPELSARAHRARTALEPRGLGLPEALEPPPPPSPLASGSIARALQHPLVREGAMLGKLPALLALVPVPDHGMLRDYCERLSPRQHAAAARALEDACHVLGVPGVQAYVSRGSKGIGIRAYEGTPHFVLVGGKHLDLDSEYLMHEAELRFAIAAEIAHLRYGHARVTSSEVWAGALNKTREGLDVALGILPVLRGWRFAERMGRVAQRIPADAVKRALSGALNWRRRSESARRTDHPRESMISAINEDLIAAHRVMQLTADRAGLLLTGDVAGAFRSMLQVRPDYRDILLQAEGQGLARVITRRAAEGELVHPDLALRIAALLAFYLSDDYTRLSEEVWGA